MQNELIYAIDVCHGTSNCFITLKDHTENFANHPTARFKIWKIRKSEELANWYWIKSRFAYARNWNLMSGKTQLTLLIGSRKLTRNTYTRSQYST